MRGEGKELELILVNLSSAGIIPLLTDLGVDEYQWSCGRFGFKLGFDLSMQIYQQMVILRR